jgi:hypothetical protein
MFVAFDRDMNPVLRDCVKFYHPSVPVHPQKDHHALGLFVFRGAEIVSMTIEALPSPPSMLTVSLLATGDLNAHLRGSVGLLPWLFHCASCHRILLLLLPPTGLVTWRLVPHLTFTNLASPMRSSRCAFTVHLAGAPPHCYEADSSLSLRQTRLRSSSSVLSVFHVRCLRRH